MFIGIYFSSVLIRNNEEENCLFMTFAHFTAETSFSIDV